MKWRTPVAVGISIATLVVLVVYFQVRRDVDVLAELQGFDARIIPLALGLHASMHLAWATRLWILGNGLGMHLPWTQAWRLATAGQFGGAVTPGRVGAEAMRMTLLVRWGKGGKPAGRLVLADRATDVLFFLVVGAVTVALITQIFGPDAAVLATLAWIGLAMLLTAGSLLFLGVARPDLVAGPVHMVVATWRRIFRRPPSDVRPTVTDYLTAVRTGIITLTKERPWRIVAAMLLSLLLWASEFSVLWVVLDGFGHHLDPALVVIAAIVLTVLAPVPVSPGGAGVVEFAAVILIGALAGGVSPAFVVVWRSVTYYYDIVIGGAVATWSLR